MSEAREIVVNIAAALQKRNWRIAVAESLTCGRLVSTLGAGPDAADWLAGSVVAYASEVKFKLLGVDPGPVITASCARQLATGVVGLLDAEVGVGVTGCGGPDKEEGQPPGTVFVAIALGNRLIERAYTFSGPPDRVLEQTVDRTLQLLEAAMTDDS